MNLKNDPSAESRIYSDHASRRDPTGLIWTRGRSLKNRGFASLALLLLVAAGIAILGNQISTVRTNLEGAVTLVPQIRTQLSEGDKQGAEATFKLMQAHSSAARSTTRGFMWTLASEIPFIGQNFGAVAEVAASADDVISRAVSPLIEIHDTLNWQNLSLSGGRIDVTPLQDASPAIFSASETVRMSHDRLASLDRSRLMPEIAEPLSEATEQLRKADEALGAVSSAARLLPAILGADGPRNYLLLVQNSAESRATGGISGALAVLSTDDGSISLTEQTSAGAMGTFAPAIKVDSEQVALYTDRLGTQMQNVNLTPDFPTAAETAKSMWEHNSGPTIDGVLAIDPVVLSHLLGVTGPVELLDPVVLSLISGTSLPVSLTEGNVVPTLLSDVYREIEDPTIQDSYFAAVAGQVFAAFTEGKGDSRQLMKALTTSMNEHRISVWSSHSKEQDIVATTKLAGSVKGPNASGATFGAYFNDGTGAKMDYYSSRTVQLLQSCPVGGHNDYTVRMTATNNAPLDAATSLPTYVTGGGVFGVDAGKIRTNYVVYGPAQSFVETAAINGEPVPLGSGKHGQRPVGTVTLELGPGETAVIEVSFSRVVQDSEPRMMVTPSIASQEEVILPMKREVSCE